jgi:hypothetical protein
MSVNPLHKVQHFFLKRSNGQVLNVNGKTLSEEDEAICQLLERQSTSPVIYPAREVIDRIMKVRPIEQPISINRS